MYLFLSSNAPMKSDGLRFEIAIDDGSLSGLRLLMVRRPLLLDMPFFFLTFILVSSYLLYISFLFFFCSVQT